jgi:murein L,D-transpeptidase YcbB/YkuD
MAMNSNAFVRKKKSLIKGLTLRLIADAVLSFTLVAASLSGSAAQNLSDQADELLRARIEAAGGPPQIVVGNELIYASFALPSFYEKRAYRLAWSDDDGPLSQLEALIQAIKGAGQEGLTPADYHLAKIETFVKQVRQNQENRFSPTPRLLVDLDLLATDAFLIYGSHLLAGRVNPETIDPEWIANRRDADFASVLQVALDSNQVEQTLTELLPPQPGYARLKQVLASYKEIAAKGGWPVVPQGPKMQKDDRGERIALLRARLFASGELNAKSTADSTLFDEELDLAVRGFQHRYGLDADGTVGPATLEALNVSAQKRVEQIRVNLERWRWLPQNLGERYILVNIANFGLDVIEQTKPIMTMRVVVGKYFRRTPVFSDRMTYLVLSPYWHVPPRIAVEDKLPLIRKNPDYLSQENIKVYQGWDAKTKEIDPKSIDWSQITARNFNYRLRQEPGPKNALGRVKFMFPNKFDVYLHDTPSRELFSKTVRTFSSGCIRIEKPIELAEYLLQKDPQWNRESILDAIDKRIERTVLLPESIPIHLLYWTAWAEEDGTVQFRNDIYGRDKLLCDALAEEPPCKLKAE